MSGFGRDNNDNAPTRLIKGNKTKRVSPEDGATEKLDSSSAFTEKLDSSSGATEKLSPDSASSSNAFTEVEKGTSSRDSDGNKTVVFRPSSSESSKDSMDINPTIGWLVIIDGPGRGKSLDLHYGLLKIGRNASQDVALNFGDDEISRENHASLEYDPKTREFYLSKGEGRVYLNDSRVGQGQEYTLKIGDQISLGGTLLRFVPFCDEQFCWTEQD